MLRESQPATRLPVYVTRFVGREGELQSLRLLLLGTRNGPGHESAPTAERQRLLTFVGPGGCGKTRLAVELARSLLPPRADEHDAAGLRIHWVDLASASDAGGLSRVSSAFHVREVPDRPLDRDAVAVVTRRYRVAGSRVSGEGCCHASRQVGADEKGTAGAPGGIRTPNLLIRSQMLYPLSHGRRLPALWPATPT